MAPIEINTKSIVLATLAGVTILYVIYSYFPAKSQPVKLKTHTSWKTASFVDIPEDVIQKAKDVKIEERHSKFSVDGQEVDILVKEASPGENAKFNVLLLHGAAFTSQTWKDLVSQTYPNMNTISMIAAAGYRVIAVDLPGYGKSKSEKLKDVRTKVKVMEHVISDLDLDRPVIVSPSMSGTFSVGYVMGNDPSKCLERSRGYVPVAPGNTDSYKERWGQSEKSRLDAKKRAQFLEAFIKEKHLDRPVVVSPSMSGSYAIPFIMGSTPADCTSRVRGYVPIAPVGYDMYEPAQYHRCEIPAMVVYGTKDKGGKVTSDRLSNLPNSRVLPYEDAPHPCYLDHQDQWHRDLYNFLLVLDDSQSLDGDQ